MSRFPLHLVRPDEKLADALALIERNRHRTVVVVDDRGVVLGTLSDGDARKAILDRRLLSTPVDQVMNTNFVALPPERTSEAAEILEREHIFVLPLVGAQGELIDLLFAYE
jgi:CBS domain-containing protein